MKFTQPDKNLIIYAIYEDWSSFEIQEECSKALIKNVISAAASFVPGWSMLSGGGNPFCFVPMFDIHKEANEPRIC